MDHPSSSVSYRSSNTPPSASNRDHEFRHSIARSTVTEELRDHATSQPNMNQQTSKEVQEKFTSRVRRRWHNILAFFKDVYMQNKRKRPLGEAPGTRQSVIAISQKKWNVLLVFIPLSWTFHFVNFNNTAIFICSFLAIIPLTELVAFATEQLSLYLGPVAADLFKNSLGNTVELILGIVALVKCELTLVQSTLVGSFLSNLLLVMGVCFFAGGSRFSEQGFGIAATQLNSSLLTLCVIAVLLPGAIHYSIQPTSDTVSSNTLERHEILSISHSVAAILLFIYLCFIFFQLHTHREFYNSWYFNAHQSVRYEPRVEKRLHISNRRSYTAESSTQPYEAIDLESVRGAEANLNEEDELEAPQLGRLTSIILLVVVTSVVGITGECLVNSIDGLTSNGHISKQFIGLILIPIVGSWADYREHVTAATTDKLTLYMISVVGLSIQMALFVIPFIVILGWILGKPLTFLFDPFESIVLFLSVLTHNYTVQDSKSNWLKGMILIGLYAIIAVTFWYYPGSDPAGVLATCR